MPCTPTDDPQGAPAQALREQLESLRVENARLREENQRLRSALDAHLARAGSPAVFGPLELSAGTCVGPHRRVKARS